MSILVARPLSLGLVADLSTAQVVSAPTGAGKTVLFELAIVASLKQDHNNRIVYLAPTKALCAERARDWNSKFKDGLGISWSAMVLLSI